MLPDGAALLLGQKDGCIHLAAGIEFHESVHLCEQRPQYGRRHRPPRGPRCGKQNHQDSNHPHMMADNFLEKLNAESTQMVEVQAVEEGRFLR